MQLLLQDLSYQKSIEQMLIHYTKEKIVNDEIRLWIKEILVETSYQRAKSNDTHVPFYNSLYNRVLK